MKITELRTLEGVGGVAAASFDRTGRFLTLFCGPRHDSSDAPDTLIATTFDVESGCQANVKTFPDVNCTDGIVDREGSKMLASRGWRKGAFVLDLDTGQTTPAPLPADATVDSLAFAGDWQSAYLGQHDGSLCVWNIRTGAMQHVPVTLSGAAITALAAGKDARTVWVGTQDGALARADIESGEVKRWSANDLSRKVTGVALTVDGAQVVTWSHDWSLRFHQYDDPLQVIDRTEHRGWILTAAFSANGRFAVTGGTDHTIVLWDVKRREAVGKWDVSAQQIWKVWISPDDRLILVRADALTLWRVSE